MARNTPPLSPNLPMVDPDTGQPTPFFMRWWQDQIDTNLQIVPLTTQAEVSEVLDLIGATHGSIMYRDASLWQVLAPGTADTFLQTKGVGADPVWASFAAALDDLSDVSVSGATDGQVLTYSIVSGVGTWGPADAAAGGGSAFEEISIVQSAQSKSLTVFDNWSIPVSTDPSTNDDVWIITIVGQTDNPPTGMTFDGQAADYVFITNLGSFDRAITGVFRGITGTGSKTVLCTGSLGTEYRSTIHAYQLRNVEIETVQVQGNSSNTLPASLSLTPTRDGGFGYSLSSVRDSAPATVGGTVTEITAAPEGIVESDFRSIGFRTDDPLADGVALTYTFEESVGADDRNIGQLIMAEPKAKTPLRSLPDVYVPDRSNGDVLTYNSTTGLWEAAAPTSSVTVIDDLTDVDTSTVAPTDGQVLTWSTADSEWQPATPSGGGGGGTVDAIAPTFVGAVKQITANYNATSGSTWVDVTLQAANIDNAGSGSFDGTNQFVVPAGVTQVVVSGNLLPNNHSDCQFRLQLNGSSLAINQGRFAAEVAETSYTNGGESFSSTLIDVTAGDLIKLQIFTSSTAINWNGAVMVEAKTHTLGTAPPAPFRGFRAQANATQAISASTFTQVVFGNEIFDTDDGFASNEFVVPASWDGQYADLTAETYYAAAAQGATYLQLSTNGGSSWSTIAMQSHTTSSIVSARNCSTGPYLMSTDDRWRVMVFEAGAETIANDVRTFFAGQLIQSSPPVDQVYGTDEVFYFDASDKSDSAIPVDEGPNALTVTNNGVNVTSGVYEFDDVAGDYFTIPAAETYLGARPFIFTLKKVNLDDLTTTGGIAGCWDTGTSNRMFLVRTASTVIDVFVSSNGTTSTAALSSGTLTAGVDYDVTVYRTGDYLYLEIDGAVVDSYSLGAGFIFHDGTTQPWEFGTYAPGTRDFDGSFESARLEIFGRNYARS